MRSVYLTLSMLAAFGCGSQSSSAWKVSQAPDNPNLFVVYGFAGNDVWAAGDSMRVLHYDGTAWTRKVISSSSQSAQLRAMWGRSPTELWIAGSFGTVLRWNGTSVDRLTLEVNGAQKTNNIDSVMGDGQAVYFCASDGLFVYQTNAFHELSIGQRSIQCRGLVSMENGAVAMLIEDQGKIDLYRLAGSTGTLQKTFDLGTSNRNISVGPNEFWSLSPNSDVLTKVVNGVTSAVSLPNQMVALSGWANSPRDVWLAGQQGFVAHFDGNTITLTAAGDYDAPTIKSVWSNGNVTWVVGGDWAMFRED